MSEDHSPDQSAPASNCTEAQNAQRLAAIDDVRRIMKEEVRTDWIDLWEERWKRRLEVLQPGATSRRKSRGGAAEGGVKLERESVCEKGEDDEEADDDGDDGDDDDDSSDDNDDDYDQGEWDGAGIGWDADQIGGEEVWVHRGEDSDFLKATDTYPSPGLLPRSPPPAQRNNVLGSPGRGGGGGEGWTAPVTRLMGGMGFGSSPPQLQPQLQSQPQLQLQSTRNNAAPIYHSSSTTPSFTAGTTPATISANPSAPSSPHPPPASPYRFASPDSIIPSLAVLREKRREELKRQMDLSDPEGNVGLKCWVERRDAWTGANEEGCVKVGRSKFAEVGYNPLGDSD